MPWICTFGSSLSLLLRFLSPFMCTSVFSFNPLLQILMSVAPPLNLVAQRSTASTQWVPTSVRGSWFVAVATMLVPMGPNVLVRFAIRYSSYLILICFFHPNFGPKYSSGERVELRKIHLNQKSRKEITFRKPKRQLLVKMKRMEIALVI